MKKHKDGTMTCELDEVQFLEDKLPYLTICGEEYCIRYSTIEKDFPSGKDEEPSYNIFKCQSHDLIQYNYTLEKSYNKKHWRLIPLLPYKDAKIILNEIHRILYCRECYPYNEQEYIQEFFIGNYVKALQKGFDPEFPSLEQIIGSLKARKKFR